MSNQGSAAARPDAFKARMAEAQAAGRPELAHQSLGRTLSEVEERFADALMAVYAEGVSDGGQVAEALAAKGIARPSTGTADWTSEVLAAELLTLNADLDKAYEDNGFGA